MVRLFPLLLLAVCSLAAPATAFAWGQEGHSIVAELAQRRLTPGARNALEAILGLGVSLASVSSWPDDWRANGHDETRRWHFVDIDIASGTTFDPSHDCQVMKDGDCIVAALGRFIAVLSDRDLTPVQKRPALMFVTHLVGDIHQPLHCSERNNDAGGNDFWVTFDGKKEHRPTAMKFHALWDETLILERTYAWGTLVADIETAVMPALDPHIISEGSLADWANDCHDAGVAAYAALGEGSPTTNDSSHPLALGVPYADATVAIIKTQLAKGGIRLALILNSALSSSGAAQ